jgi:hypothetical protein
MSGYNHRRPRAVSVAVVPEIQMRPGNDKKGEYSNIPEYTNKTPRETSSRDKVLGRSSRRDVGPASSPIPKGIGAESQENENPSLTSEEGDGRHYLLDDLFSQKAEASLEGEVGDDRLEKREPAALDAAGSKILSREQ